MLFGGGPCAPVTGPGELVGGGFVRRQRIVVICIVTVHRLADLDSKDGDGRWRSKAGYPG